MRVGCVAQGREAGQPADRPQRAPGAGGLRLVSEARRGRVRALERGGRHARLHLARDPPRAPRSPFLLVLHLFALTDSERARRQWRTDTASTAASATGGVWYACLLPLASFHLLTLSLLTPTSTHILVLILIRNTHRRPHTTTSSRTYCTSKGLLAALITDYLRLFHTRKLVDPNCAHVIRCPPRALTCLTCSAPFPLPLPLVERPFSALSSQRDGARLEWRAAAPPPARLHVAPVARE